MTDTTVATDPETQQVEDAIASFLADNDPKAIDAVDFRGLRSVCALVYKRSSSVACVRQARPQLILAPSFLPWPGRRS